MREALARNEKTFFPKPEYPERDGQKPVMRGIWQGGETYTIDTVSGKLATEYTPKETQKEVAIQNVRSILYWVDKSNPLGPPPTDPAKDPQFERWEVPVRLWAEANGFVDETSPSIPTEVDDVHTPENMPRLSINNLVSSTLYGLSDTIPLLVTSSGRYPLSRVQIFINDRFVAELPYQPFIYRFSPKDIPDVQETNSVRVVGIDSVYNRAVVETTLLVRFDG